MSQAESFFQLPKRLSTIPQAVIIEGHATFVVTEIYKFVVIVISENCDPRCGLNLSG